MATTSWWPPPERSPTARERGQLRLEGKDYCVQDGEICHFRFSPAR